MRKKEKYDVGKCVSKLQGLVKINELGKHLEIALDGNELQWLSDKELFETLNEYVISLEIDGHSLEDDRELNKIIKQGMNLNNILDEESEEY